MWQKIILTLDHRIHFGYKCLLYLQIIIGEYTVCITACHLSYKLEGIARDILIDFFALYTLNQIDNILGEVYQSISIDYYDPQL